jgi:transcriptional regulator with XRE-family HTH domain
MGKASTRQRGLVAECHLDVEELFMMLRGLRQARQRQGLSISQLAEMTGLRRESISRFEHGQEEPQPYALRRLSTVLETPLAELCGLPAAEAKAHSMSR